MTVAQLTNVKFYDLPACPQITHRIYRGIATSLAAALVGFSLLLLAVQASPPADRNNWWVAVSVESDVTP